MPVTRPRLVDNFVGLLKTGVSAVGTTLVSDNFVSLPDDFSTTNAMPLVIADDSQGISEFVLVVGHAAGTTSITVIRGARGTVARQWDSGSIVRVAVGARDLTQAMSAAAAAALGDTHVGMEVVDENLRLRKQTGSQGFQHLARVMPGGIGAGLGLGSPGAGLELLAQTLYIAGNTSSGGYINGNLPAGAFPNAILGVLATPHVSNSESLWHPLFFQGFDGAGASTKGPGIQFRILTYNNAALTNTAVKFSALILGV